MNYSPSINLIYDIIECSRNFFPEYSSKFSIVAAQELVFRYSHDKITKPDDSSHTYSDLSKLVDSIIVSIKEISNLVIPDDDILQLIKCIVNCKGVYSVMDRLNCYFWFLLRMNLSDAQLTFVRNAIQDMESEDFISEVQKDCKYPIHFFLSKSI